MMSDGGGQGGGSESSKPYDYLLKFLLVGDSDVGKHEILQPLEDGSTESPFCVGSGEFCLAWFIAGGGNREGRRTLRI